MAKAQHARRYRLVPAMLRRIREEAGLTQRQLAVAMGMDHVAIHKSETGDRRVDVAEFMDWCVACGQNPVEAFALLRKSRGV